MALAFQKWVTDVDRCERPSAKESTFLSWDVKYIFFQLPPYKFHSLSWTQWSSRSITHTFSAALVQAILSFMKIKYMSCAKVSYNLCRQLDYRQFDSQKCENLVRVFCVSIQVIAELSKWDWRTRCRHACGVGRSPDLGSHFLWCRRHL